MGEFVTNPATTLPGPKSDRVALPASENADRWIRAEDFNALRDAANDLRDEAYAAQGRDDSHGERLTAVESLAAAPNTALVTATGSTTPLSLAEWMAQVINVKAFGAVGDGVADDTAAIQAAATFASAATAAVVILNAGTYRTTATITVPKNVSFVMSDAAEIVYVGSGIAILLDGDGLPSFRRHTFRVRKATQGWHTGTDVASVGVRVKNVNHSEFNIVSIQGFHKGLELYGDLGGTCYNDFRIGKVVNNKFGITHTAISYPSGWTNGNTFRSGAVRIDSAYGGVAGSILADLTQANGSQLLGVNLEGGYAEKTLVIGADSNVILGCRFEQGLKVHLLATAHYNLILGGYDNLGADSHVAQNSSGDLLFLDEGFGNVILGGRGLRLAGDDGGYGGDALALRALTSSTNVMLRTESASGGVHFRLNASGVASFYDTPGDSQPAGAKYPEIQIDALDQSIKTGDGTQAPTALVRVFDQGRADLLKTLRSASGGRFASTISTVSGTSVNLSTAGQILKTNNGAPTTLATFTNGATGQTLTLIAGDANTTIAHNASTKLSGSASWLMPLDATLTLVLDAGGVWRETARTTP